MKTTIIITAFVAVAATAPVNPYWRYEHLRTLNVTEVKRVNPCCYRGETVAAPNCPLGPRSLDDLCQDNKHPSDHEETPVTPETERHEHLIPLRGHPKAKGSIEHRSQESPPRHDNLIPLRRHPKAKGRIQYHSEEFVPRRPEIKSFPDRDSNEEELKRPEHHIEGRAIPIIPRPVIVPVPAVVITKPVTNTDKPLRVDAADLDSETLITPTCTMSGNGSRSRDGCFNCRSRKRKCDQEKPVCRRCRKMGDNCVFPEPASASNPLKFVVAASPNHYVVPIPESHQPPSFLNLSPRELVAILQEDKEQDNSEDNPLSNDPRRESQALVPFPRVISPFAFGQQPDGPKSIETALVQYYVEVISSSRVYVQTGRNGFRTSVIPRVLYQQGPLLSAVLAMSAAEWGQNIVLDGRDYRALSMQYKVRALQELQHTLPDSQSSEGNLLTCVLLASLEIAQGSRPTWLRHLQGALALVDSFGATIDPSVAQFALQYFRFRYILMETTQPTRAQGQEANDSVDLAMAGLARAEANLPTIQGTRGLIDEQIGCSMDLVDIINEISALSLVSGGHDDTLSKDHLYMKGQEIEHRIAQLSVQDTNTEEYLLKSAHFVLH
ncbi:hypothetical protein FDECE_18443, partial [Fusarium decemcellulare]